MKRLRSSQSGIAKGFMAFGAVWVLYACAYLAAVIGLVYVAVHFIAKFW